MSTDAVMGSTVPLQPEIYALRGHAGQIEVAAAMRALLDGSVIRESHREGDTRIQDPYCIRCQPQVTGAAMDVLRMTARTLEIEANAATDNPLVLTETGMIVSGGNFHAEPVGFAADMIALALSEIGSIAPRRIALMMDPTLSFDLPPFLTSNPGLNSGLMIAEVTTAALMSENKHLHRWLDMAQERIALQGLPARICWIGLGERHRAGLMFNEMVASGELKSPIVIGRDHLDSGSVANPNRETEAMKDGSDAVSDWPLLNALVNTASRATWVSLHHGGGVGMGFSQHAGVVIVADGTPEAAKRLERVLWNDLASGVWRHADAGYETAIQCAKDYDLRLPGILGN